MMRISSSGNEGEEENNLNDYMRPTMASDVQLEDPV